MTVEILIHDEREDRALVLEVLTCGELVVSIKNVVSGEPREEVTIQAADLARVLRVWEIE